MIQTQLHFAKGGVKMSMPLSALPLVVPGLDKHVVRDGIPGVVNADEEQQQHRRYDAKQSLAQMGAPYADTANVTYAAKGNRTWNNQSSNSGWYASCARIRRVTMAAYAMPLSPTNPQRAAGMPIPWLRMNIVATAVIGIRAKINNTLPPREVASLGRREQQPDAEKEC